MGLPYSILTLHQPQPRYWGNNNQSYVRSAMHWTNSRDCAPWRPMDTHVKLWSRDLSFSRPHSDKALSLWEVAGSLPPSSSPFPQLDHLFPFQMTLNSTLALVSQGLPLDFFQNTLLQGMRMAWVLSQKIIPANGPISSNSNYYHGWAK